MVKRTRVVEYIQQELDEAWDDWAEASDLRMAYHWSAEIERLELELDQAIREGEDNV